MVGGTYGPGRTGTPDLLSNPLVRPAFSVRNLLQFPPHLRLKRGSTAYIQGKSKVTCLPEKYALRAAISYCRDTSFLSMGVAAFLKKACRKLFSVSWGKEIRHTPRAFFAAKSSPIEVERLLK